MVVISLAKSVQLRATLPLPTRLDGCSSSCVSGVAYGLLSAYQISIVLLSIKRRPVVEQARTEYYAWPLYNNPRSSDAAEQTTRTPGDYDATAARPSARGRDVHPESVGPEATKALRRDVTTSGGGSVAKMALLFYTLYGFAIFFFAGWWFVWLLHLLAIFNG